MPAKPRWWLHIPEIRSLLAECGLPVIDRSAVERLFGLRRRQAIELMNRCGGYQTGRTLLVGREQLIAYLDALADNDEFQRETGRRERLASNLERIQRTRASEAVRIPISPEIFACRLQSLTPGVHLEAGKLEIEFSGPQDLLRKLFGLAQAVANDYAGFERAATGRQQIPA